MSTSSGNRTLSSAKAAKQDEFYTQLADIANELKHYKDHFKGKVVLCNCDDPYESNFFKYFAANFNTLGLKKLVTTSYAGSPIVGGQLPLMVMEGLKPYLNPLAPMNGGERGQGVRGRTLLTRSSRYARTRACRSLCQPTQRIPSRPPCPEPSPLRYCLACSEMRRKPLRRLPIKLRSSRA